MWEQKHVIHIPKPFLKKEAEAPQPQHTFHNRDDAVPQKRAMLGNNAPQKTTILTRQPCFYLGITEGISLRSSKGGNQSQENVSSDDKSHLDCTAKSDFTINFFELIFPPAFSQIFHIKNKKNVIN
jgi:hypothetical protein